MTVRIYNSLTRRKEDFIPLDGKKVKMYCCGVTVYDKCHIGHARSLYLFDVIRTYLESRGYDVTFVRNITDVDDKILNKGLELNLPFETVVEENIGHYRKDVKNLGVRFADKEPRATEYIPGMVSFISRLIDKGYAYEAEGDVYFRVRSFEDYGRLSGQSIDQMMEATRIGPDPSKKDPLDFALWKKAKPGEVSWPSPWSQGRPGWHIECSCMSMKELGSETIDIHAGGRDLIFPHHENEIAQSEALTGKPFARYWIHHGLLTIDGQKMAKSLNNFIVLEDVLARFPADVLKLFYLQSHYASPIDFSWEKMEEVKKAYERIRILLDRLERAGVDPAGENDMPGDGEVTGVRHEFVACMDDDFNTSKALAVVFDLVNRCHQWLDGDAHGHKERLSQALGLFREMFRVFGWRIAADETRTLDPGIGALLKERAEARSRKDFRRSDEIRDELREKGIVVEDGKAGQSWRRI